MVQPFLTEFYVNLKFRKKQFHGKNRVGYNFFCLETDSILFVIAGFLRDDRGSIALTSSEAISLNGQEGRTCPEPKHLEGDSEQGE